MRFFLLFFLVLGCLSSQRSHAQARVDYKPVIRGYAYLTFTVYKDALIDAQTLRQEIVNYIDHPSRKNLALAKDMWTIARESYAQTEAFRFYGGPIDSVLPDADGKSVEERLNRCQAGEGYHFIRAQLDYNKKGMVDFLLGRQKPSPVLLSAVDDVIDQLEFLVDQWAPGDYRVSFSEKGALALGDILTGLATLSAQELADNRLPELSNDSLCVSGAKFEDIPFNLKGIKNIYFAFYDGVDAPSLHQLLSRKAPGVAQEIVDQLYNLEVAVRTFPENRDEIIEQFKYLGSLFVRAGQALDVSVRFDLS